MRMCIYVCVSIYLHLRMCICVCISMYVYLHMCIYLCVSTPVVCIYTCIHLHEYTLIQLLCVYVYTYMYIHICIYIYTTLVCIYKYTTRMSFWGHTYTCVVCISYNVYIMQYIAHGLSYMHIYMCCASIIFVTRMANSHVLCGYDIRDIHDVE